MDDVKKQSLRRFKSQSFRRASNLNTQAVKRIKSFSSFDAANTGLHNIYPSLINLQVKVLKTLHLRQARSVFNVYSNESSTFHGVFLQLYICFTSGFNSLSLSLVVVFSC